MTWTAPLTLHCVLLQVTGALVSQTFDCLTGVMPQFVPCLSEDGQVTLERSHLVLQSLVRQAQHGAGWTMLR